MTLKLNEVYKVVEAAGGPGQQLRARVLRLLDKALADAQAAKDPAQASNAIRYAATEINVLMNLHCNELLKGIKP